MRALGLGDFLVAVPALRGLRRHFSDHRIVLAAPAVLAPLARWSGAVDKVLPTDGLDGLGWPADERPAVAVNLHGSGPQSHRALDATRPDARIRCRGPGWDGPSWSEVESAHTHERARWCGLLAAASISADVDDLLLERPGHVGTLAPPVVIHPGAQFGAKRWPPDRFTAVARACARAGHRVLVTGSALEIQLANTVAAGAGLPDGSVLAGRTGLGELAELVVGAALIVCGDTGIAHLASAFRTPSVVLFGPVAPQRWGPPSDGPHIVLTDTRWRRGDAFAADPDPALLAVTVADVVDAATALLRTRRGAPRR